jgi:hypothetical protein
VTRDDTGLLVVARSVASQLEDFGSQILKHGSQIDGGTGTDTLSVVALPEETVDTADGERQTSLGGTATGEPQSQHTVIEARFETNFEGRDQDAEAPDRVAMGASCG